MIDGSEKGNCQLAFELHNSHVCEKRSNIIFAFSQRWSFHYFIWPTARFIVVLLGRLHRSR